MRWCRNINLLSIAYAYPPRLRSRLTPGGLTSPGKPWAYGERVSHPFYRYSYRHQLSQNLHRSFRSDFAGAAMLPYRGIATTRSFGAMLEPRYIFGAASLDQ